MKKKFAKMLIASILTLGLALPAYAACIRVLFCNSQGNCQWAHLCCNAGGTTCWLWYQQEN